MTVSTTSNRVEYTGNGVTTTFDFAFRVLAKTHLKVTLYDSLTGVETVVATSAFNVTTLPATSGTVTYPISGSPIPATTNLIIQRVVPLSQLVDINNQTGFDANVTEEALDLATMVDQQLNEQVSRSIRLPVSDTGIAELPAVLGRAERFLYFDANGDINLNASPTAEAQSAANAAVAAAGASLWYQSRAAVQGFSIPSDYKSMRTAAYATANDGGGAQYYRVDSEPAHEGKVRTLDRFISDGSTDAVNGGWWELVEDAGGCNVRQFGAVGDGTTNDSAAIQAAIDFVALRPNGGNVRFPRGDYLLSTALTISTDSVVLVGEAPPAYANISNIDGADDAARRASYRAIVPSRLIADSGTAWAANAALVNFTTPLASGRWLMGCGLRNLAIDCAETIDIGVEIKGMNGGRFMDAAVLWPNKIGWSLGVQSGNDNQPLTHCHFERLLVLETARINPSTAYGGFVFWGDNRTLADDGVQIRSNANLSTVLSCYASMSNAQGFQLEECDGLAFVGCLGKMTIWGGEGHTKSIATSNIANSYGARHNHISHHQGTITCKAAVTASGHASQANVIVALTGNSTTVVMEPGDVTTGVDGARALVTRSQTTDAGVPQDETPGVVGMAPLGVIVRKNATQSLTNAAVEAIIWQLQDHDDFDSWAASPEPTWITVPPGVFGMQVGASVEFASNATGHRTVGLQRSTDGGSTFLTVNSVPRVQAAPVSGDTTIVSLGSPMIPVQPGEVYRFVATQTSGGPLDVVNGFGTWASVRWL